MAVEAGAQAPGSQAPGSQAPGRLPPGGGFLVAAETGGILTPERLTPEQRAIRDAVEAFVEREAVPRREALEAKDYATHRDLLAKLGRFDEAIASYRQAARVQPDQPEAYYNLALAYLETGDRESAMAQSRTLESLAPDLNKKLLAEMKQ